MATLAAVPVGAIKQFGPYGPEYEVLGSAEPEDGKAMAKIVLVRTSEELNYPLEAIIEDPEAE
jgi:hypothetical protein